MPEFVQRVVVLTLQQHAVVQLRHARVHVRLQVVADRVEQTARHQTAHDNSHGRLANKSAHVASTAQTTTLYCMFPIVTNSGTKSYSHVEVFDNRIAALYHLTSLAFHKSSSGRKTHQKCLPALASPPRTCAQRRLVKLHSSSRKFFSRFDISGKLCS